MAAAPEAWETPVPLDAAMRPPWPSNVFPAPVQAFIDALAVSTETPPELPAMMTLAVLATCAQGKFRVHCQTHFEPLCLWTCCALPPGSRKTAVYQAATAPLVQWECERRAEYEPVIKRTQSEIKTLQERVDALRKQAAKAAADKVEGIQREIGDIEARMPMPVSVPQLWTGDCTPEQLAVIMADNRECMALLADEGGMLDTMAGRYSNGIPNLDIYNDGHAGSAVRVNRGSRPPLFLKHPCLSVGICPQPDVVNALTDKPGFRGRGLLARFLYAMPESNLGRRGLNPPPMGDDVRDGYRDVIRAMLGLTWNTDAEGRPCAHVLKLAPESYDALMTFARAVEAAMRDGGTFAHITDWAGKMPGAVARIAAVFHIARYAFNTPEAFTVGIDDMIAAIRIGEVLGKHALIAFAAMGADAAMDDARAILAWIQRDNRKAFPFREAHNAHQRRMRTRNVVQAALNVLIERGHIRLVPKPVAAGPGRPSEMYEVNPSCAVVSKS